MMTKCTVPQWFRTGCLLLLLTGMCLISAWAGPLSRPVEERKIRPDSLHEESSGTNPERLWGSGTTTVSSAVMTAIQETKARMAARTAYLQAEALSYGAQVSAVAQADRDTAAGLFQYLDNRGNYVENLGLQDLTVLPVGLRKTLSDGNGLLELGILKATFFPTYAELTVFVRLKLPSPDPNSSIKERELFFGVDKVRFTRDGGISGNFQVVLLGDFVQPLGNMTLRIKGGLDRRTGATSNITSATVSCEKLVQVKLAAEVLFPRSMLVPVSEADGSVQQGQVRGDISVDADDFNSIVASISMTPFAVTGHEKFGFKASNVTLDLSEKANAPGVVFPANYFTNSVNSNPDGATSGSSITTWKGVYIKDFSILLPPEFKNKDTGQPLRIFATNMIFDRNGVTGAVGMTGSSFGMSASGWAMSLTDFALNFEKNSLLGGSFGGQLTLPIAPQSPLRYDGIIDSKSDYELSLTMVNQLSFDVWRAKAQLDPSSRVKLTVVNGAFKPKALLHGRLGIFTTVGGAEATKESARIGFDGVVFEGLALQTEKPYIAASYFGYEGSSKLGGFPVTVDKVGVLFAGDTVGLQFKLQVNLMKDKFGGETDFTVVGSFDNSTGVQRWQFRRILVSGICVNGTVGPMSLAGCARFFENDAVYGDGFGGKISFSTTVSSATAGKSPIDIKGDVAAFFGSKDFRYWFVGGSASLSQGVPIVPPLEINAFYLSAYHNMKPMPGTAWAYGSTVLGSPMASVAYQPDQSIHLGVKAAVGLRAIDDNVFKGTAGMEMTFSKHDGLLALGFYGEGELMGGFTTQLDKLNKLRSKYETIVNAEKNSLIKETLTKGDLDQKSKQNGVGPSSATNSIVGRIAMLYDRTNGTLDGDAEVFVDVAGMIRGNGAGGKAGWMLMHFDSQEWYVHVGSPEPGKRLGLTVGFPGVRARTEGYFMVGHRIPNMPPPPPEVANLIPQWNASNFKRPDADVATLKQGKGIAFGTTMSVRFDIDLWIPYLRVDALMGFDMMLRTNTNCRPADKWYGRGQAYAYLQGEAGVKILGRRPLVTVAAATLLDGGMPDPAWMQGNFALQLKLGKKFNRTVDFDLALNKNRICR